MRLKIGIVLALLAAMLPVAADAVVVSVAVGDRPYYVHGPGYYVGPAYYVWVPGHWRWHYNHRVWVHGHYVRR